MIVPNQKNVKVHFAAVENIYQYGCVKEGGSKYMLMTAFPLICHKIGLKTIAMDGGIKERIPKIVSDGNRHSIMDSGLFTLMFGSHKGNKDKDFIYKWYDLLTDFIKTSGFKGSCVEVDCQKVLGPDEAWILREKMASDLENRIINVFHLEDGQKGLDRLIEFSNYIAISVPELRFSKKKNQVANLAHYIKNKKPEIDIHLLGCTEGRLLKELSFCSSADSSSYTSVVRYGWFDMANGQKRAIKNMRNDKFESEYLYKAQKFVDELGIKQPSPKTMQRYCALIFQV